MRRLYRAAVPLGVAALLGSATPVSAEVIDRVLAVVQGEIITQSDVTAARTLGLVAVPQAPDQVAAAMERLIDRALMLLEVERYSPPEPSDAAIGARLAQVRARFASDAEVDRALAASGLTRDQLRRLVRDDLRIKAYLDGRFGAAADSMDVERGNPLVAEWMAGLRRRAQVSVLYLPNRK